MISDIKNYFNIKNTIIWYKTFSDIKKWLLLYLENTKTVPHNFIYLLMDFNSKKSNIMNLGLDQNTLIAPHNSLILCYKKF